MFSPSKNKSPIVLPLPSPPAALLRTREERYYSWTGAELLHNRLRRLFLAAMFLGISPLLGCGDKPAGSAEQAGQTENSLVGNPAPGASNSVTVKTELEKIGRFLPDNVNLLARIRVDAIAASRPMEEIDKAVPGTRKKFEKRGGGPIDPSGVEPGNLVTMYLAGAFRGEPFRILLTKSPVSKATLVESAGDDDEVREVKVGDFSMCERMSYRSMYERKSEKPIFDGTGMAFCVVEPTLVVYGQANQLKATLERDKAVELPESMYTALRKADPGKPVTVVAHFKELRGKPGPWDQDPIAKALVDSVDYAVGQIALDADIVSTGAVLCKDEEAAAELKKMADGGLVMLKFQKDTPKEVVKLIDAVKLERRGSELVASLTIRPAEIAAIIEKEQKNAEEPAYLFRRLSTLIEDLGSDRAETRRSACGDLGWLGPLAKPAVPALAKALKDPVKEVRTGTALSLERIGPEAREAVPALIAALGDDSETDVRGRAAQALGAIGYDNPAAVEALVKALADPARDVRSYAISALGRLGPDGAAATPALVKIMNDPDAGIQRGAVYALGSIGPGAKDAAPALAVACLKGSPRDEIGRALARITAIPPQALIDALAGTDARARPAPLKRSASTANGPSRGFPSS